MISLLIFLVLLMSAAFILEYKEGMIMLQDKDANDINHNNNKGGVKEHKYYKQTYHWINTVACLLVFLASVFAIKGNVYKTVSNGFYIPFIIGLYFLLNEVSELAYSKSRFNQWIPEYERFYFLEIYTRLIEGYDKVIELHCKRIILAFTYIIFSIF